MCCTSWRSERMENSVWMRLARNSRSGGMPGRPMCEYSFSKLECIEGSTPSTTTRSFLRGWPAGIRCSSVR